MQVSGKGALFGLAFDALTGAFPLGTGIGALAKNLFNLDAKDMNRAYDPKRAAGPQAESFGDLKGMLDGLLGKLQKAVDGLDPKAKPTSDAHAAASARPRVDADAQTAAQQKSGLGGWGKALLWGGAALAGLSLLNDTAFFGFAGMPFYGAGMGMHPGMMGMPYGMWW